MQEKWVVGNWKMNGDLAQAKALLIALKSSVPTSTKLHCAVCPPLLYMGLAQEILRESSIMLGAQNLCAEHAEKGAYTGEVSAAMLADIGVQLVLVGHSERREYYTESNAIVAQKFMQAQKMGLKPILCVGETLEQRESGQAEAVIQSQLMAVIERYGVAVFANALIAYEPVWAIGTGLTATPEQAQAIHVFIRQLLAEKDEKIAQQTPILYGGSMNAENAQALLAMADINGGLIGGASLKAEEFTTICTLVG
jgi:triosephosphate isomerase (TIM)